MKPPSRVKPSVSHTLVSTHCWCDARHMVQTRGSRLTTLQFRYPSPFLSPSFSFSFSPSPSPSPSALHTPNARAPVIVIDWYPSNPRLLRRPPLLLSSLLSMGNGTGARHEHENPCSFTPLRLSNSFYPPYHSIAHHTTAHHSKAKHSITRWHALLQNTNIFTGTRLSSNRTAPVLSPGPCTPRCKCRPDLHTSRETNHKARHEAYPTCVSTIFDCLSLSLSLSYSSSIDGTPHALPRQSGPSVDPGLTQLHNAQHAP